MTSTASPSTQSRDKIVAGRLGVTVVVPCFNEQDSVMRLREALVNCEQRLSGRYDIEVILVDDASTDGTWQVLQQTFGNNDNYVLIKHPRNLGIAGGIMTGIRAASHEIVCSLDADCTYEPSQLESMLPLFTDGVDVVTASPYHPQGRTINLVRWRLAISRFATWLYRQLMRIPLHTYTSCFRIYRRSSVAPLQLSNSGFVGVPELLWRVKRNGGLVVECPATLTSRMEGQSKMRLVSVSLGHLRLMGRILFELLFVPAPEPVQSWQSKSSVGVS